MGAKKKWLLMLFFTAFLSLVLLLLSSLSVCSSPNALPSTVHHDSYHPPAFAYYISGGSGDMYRIFRLLLAVYHPRNRYLLHLGSDASDDERRRLAFAVKSVPAVQAFENVDIVGKPDWVTYMGSSNVATTLHAASILLNLDREWNWFITLSAKDYPIVTQDDLTHVFSSVRRDLNFIEHSSDLGWKESGRFKPIYVDPGLYLARSSQVFKSSEKRPIPDSFKLFTGSPWVILSRPFLEYCVLGWDNMPRTLLMYFTNIILSQEGYFHSVICNAPQFRNTTVNGDLRYMIWDMPPKMEPHVLNMSDYDQMVQSGAAFARQFEQDDSVLDMIDRRILKRGNNQATPGAWCSGQKSWWMDPCSQWGDVNVLKPGPQAKKLEEPVSNLLDDWNSQSNRCI